MKLPNQNQNFDYVCKAMYQHIGDRLFNFKEEYDLLLNNLRAIVTNINPVCDMDRNNILHYSSLYA